MLLLLRFFKSQKVTFYVFFALLHTFLEYCRELILILPFHRGLTDVGAAVRCASPCLRLYNVIVLLIQTHFNFKEKSQLLTTFSL